MYSKESLLSNFSHKLSFIVWCWPLHVTQIPCFSLVVPPSFQKLWEIGNMLDTGRSGEAKDVILNNPISLYCETNAAPPPTLTWYKDGHPLTSSDKVLILPGKGVSSRVMLGTCQGCVSSLNRVVRYHVADQGCRMPLVLRCCKGTEGGMCGWARRCSEVPQCPLCHGLRFSSAGRLPDFFALLILSWYIIANSYYLVYQIHL